jgi:hypothetical protein
MEEWRKSDLLCFEVRYAWLFDVSLGKTDGRAVPRPVDAFEVITDLWDN